jgi:hypothetical protein
VEELVLVEDTMLDDDEATSKSAPDQNKRNE